MNDGHLVSKQCSHAGLGCVTDGGEVVTSFQRQNHTAASQLHQLLSEMAETYAESQEHAE